MRRVSFALLRRAIAPSGRSRHSQPRRAKQPQSRRLLKKTWQELPPSQEPQPPPSASHNKDSSGVVTMVTIPVQDSLRW